MARLRTNRLAAAERQRRKRSRDARGMFPLTIEANADVLQLAIDARFLDIANADKRDAQEEAISRLLLASALHRKTANE